MPELAADCGISSHSLLSWKQIIPFGGRVETFFSRWGMKGPPRSFEEGLPLKQLSRCKETFVKKKRKKAEKEMNVTKSSLFMCALCD